MIGVGITKFALMTTARCRLHKKHDRICKTIIDHSKHLAFAFPFWAMLTGAGHPWLHRARGHFLKRGKNKDVAGSSCRRRPTYSFRFSPRSLKIIL